MQFALAVFVGLLLSSPVVAEPMVEGLVRFSTGEAASSAQVLVFDLTALERGPVAQATTDASGYFALSLASWGGRALPDGFALGQNYPNPFNPSTVIPYQLPTVARVRLDVFNVLGQRVATLVDGERSAGFHTVVWDAMDGAGRAMAAGVYLYRLTTAEAQHTRRMVLVDGQAGVAAPRTAPSSLASSGRSYGLGVVGAGGATYVDADFRMGSGPVALVVAAVGPQVAKVLTGSVLGDVNNDGQVDVNDALLVTIYSADSSVVMPNNGDISLGDVNADRRIDLADALLILGYIANPSDPTLPARLGQSVTAAPSVTAVRDSGHYSMWGLPARAVARLGKGLASATAFSPDGQILAVAGSAGIWLYDMETFRERALLTGHTGPLRSVSFSPDGQILADGSSDGTVILWDMATGTGLTTLQDHTWSVSSVSFSPDGQTLASGASDGTVILWDVATGTRQTTLQDHTGRVSSVSFSPDSQTLASGAWDGRVILWDVATGTSQITLQDHTGRVSSVSFSPDGQTLASGSSDGRVILWDVATGTGQTTLQSYAWGISSVSFSPDGQTLASASGSSDGTVILWDMATGLRQATLQDYWGDAGSFSFRRMAKPWPSPPGRAQRFFGTWQRGRA